MVHVFLLIGLAALLWRLPNPERTFAIILLLVGALWLYNDFWKTMDVAHKSGARAAAEYIRCRQEPGEPVIVSSPLFFFPILYYAEQRAAHYLYSDGQPIPHYHGSAILTPHDLITAEQLRALSSHRIWIVDMAGGRWSHRYIPIPPEWVEKSRTTFSEVFGIGTIIVVEYETRKVSPQQEEKP
jgi:hypothetical protein